MEKKYISTQKELDAVIGSNWEGLVIIKDTKEEINIDIKEPTKDDIIFVDYQGLHTFICYLVSVKSGEVKKGDEIFEVKAFSLKELEASLKIGAMRILSRNHANSFEAFLEKRKKRAREAENV